MGKCPTTLAAFLVHCSMPESGHCGRCVRHTLRGVFSAGAVCLHAVDSNVAEQTDYQLLYD